MVDTREREVVYTTDTADTGPSTAMVIIFSLLIVAVLGFMIYYFSNNDLRTTQPQTIIERNTNTTTPLPVPMPIPASPPVTEPVPSTPAPAPSNP